MTTAVATAQENEPKSEFSISILETVENAEDLPELLREIASKIEEGYTSGYYPSWEIVDEGAKSNG